MKRFETCISIEAPPAAIWPILSNVVSWADWLPTVRRVLPLDGDDLAPGRRFKVWQPRLPANVLRVSLLQPPRRFVWGSRSPGLQAVADHVIEEPTPGRSQVTLSVEFSGWLSGIVTAIYGRLTQQYIEQEAASLKARVLGAQTDPE